MPPDDAAIAYVQPMVEKASLALCVNQAWALLAGVALLGLILVLFTRERTDAQEFTLERRHPAPGRLDQLGP